MLTTMTFWISTELPFILLFFRDLPIHPFFDCLFGAVLWAEFPASRKEYSPDVGRFRKDQL